MIRSVQLHGRLAQRCGGNPLNIDIASPAEAVRALCSQRPGFKDELRKGSYHIIAKHPSGDISYDINEISFNLGSSSELHIIPVIEGAGKGGAIAKIVIGVAIIAGAFFLAPAILAGGLGATAFSVAGAAVTYGNIAMVGVAVALAGVSQLLAPSPQVGDKSDESFLLSGAENVQTQGSPVPIVIGRYRVGSVVMSIGIMVEQIGSDGSYYPGDE